MKGPKLLMTLVLTSSVALSPIAAEPRQHWSSGGRIMEALPWREPQV